MIKKLILLLIASNYLFSAQMSDLEHAIAESKKTAAAEAARRARINAIQETKEAAQNIEVEIQQLKVLLQKDADCGFHALKNVGILLNWLNPKLLLSTKDRDLMLNSDNVNIFPLELMRKKIRSKTALFIDEIENLAVKFYKIEKKKFSIIQNIFQIKDNLISQKPEFSAISYIDPDLGQGIKKLRTRPRAVHGFIIADASFQQEKDGSYTEVGGHWIGVVALKENNKLYLFCTNSVLDNSKHDDLKMAQALTKIILNSNYNALTLAAKDKKIKWG